jgi:hypothetical protein
MATSIHAHYTLVKFLSYADFHDLQKGDVVRNPPTFFFKITLHREFLPICE